MTHAGHLVRLVARTGENEKGQPVWGRDCLFCLYCEMHCPEDAITTDPETGAFTFNTVADGTYDLSFAASCFATQTRTGITVAGDTQDVGTVTLAEGATGPALILGTRQWAPVNRWPACLFQRKT